MHPPPDRGRPGAAAVELAVLLPFLLYLCVIATDWARLMYYAIALEACAAAGANYASDPITAAMSPLGSVEAAAKAEAPGLDADLTVTTGNGTSSDGNATVTVTVAMTFRTISNFPGVPASQTISRKAVMRVAPVTTK